MIILLSVSLYFYLYDFQRLTLEKSKIESEVLAISGVLSENIVFISETDVTRILVSPLTRLVSCLKKGTVTPPPGPKNPKPKPSPGTDKPKKRGRKPKLKSNDGNESDQSPKQPAKRIKIEGGGKLKIGRGRGKSDASVRSSIGLSFCPSLKLSGSSPKLQARSLPKEPMLKFIAKLKGANRSSGDNMLNDFFDVPRGKSYHSVVKYPMCLNTIEEQVESGVIDSLDGVISNCLLIIKNAR